MWLGFVHVDTRIDLFPTLNPAFCPTGYTEDVSGTFSNTDWSSGQLSSNEHQVISNT